MSYSESEPDSNVAINSVPDFDSGSESESESDFSLALMNLDVWIFFFFFVHYISILLNSPADSFSFPF